MKHYLFLILLLLISCKKKEVKKEMIPKDETLDLKYEVLKQLIGDQIKEDSVNGFSHENLYNIAVQRVFFEEIKENDEPPPRNMVLSFSYDSIFSKKDSVYYKEQDRDLGNFKINKNRINNKLEYLSEEESNPYNYDSARDFWDNFYKKQDKNKCVRTFSVPFFSKDKTICVVEHSESCGLNSGGGSTSIYKKINGKWIHLKSSNHWDSL